ncbi:uncharacterized protein DNG_05856 [Cephalotrichum gorgonifer]|uniref:Xylanolytic transcriptional activator regulatory domain-containing protein n=1 Tax=Cephalotrichum gorgonifer TaxID=2041049 RepID=A0AAE8N0L4_9PEZI|nr:uncharacterized protein DNG_05856 [Cephalotrichum gorgonifer]
MHDLSFILHPSHEASSPDKEQTLPSTTGGPGPENHALIQQAFHTLGLSPAAVGNMIRIYFKNMVALSLFHEPSFSEKLGSMTSLAQICALLAAVVAFAARFVQLETDSVIESEMQPVKEAQAGHPDHFLDMSLKFIDEALESCGDEAPPICIVQALIIATHCRLTRGVHGRAWRTLGMCVRLAYELDLHLVDAQGSIEAAQGDPLKWRLAEEERRAWWAIWEMDVFASTVRRTPTGIDWRQMETLLPVEDADWFRDHPAPSSALERDPVQRWKSLQDSGNRSPIAWFLVINSLMKDAQLISSPHGMPFRSHRSSPQRSARKGGEPSSYPRPVDKSRQKLEILANAVQCFVMALPQELRYRSQYLSFDAGPVSGKPGSLRNLHCGIYNIFLMIQLSRLMIYRYDLFGHHTHQACQSIGAGQFAPPDTRGEASPNFQDPDNLSVQQYFEAADNILIIVSRCSENHIRHINPFMSSTIWLATAVQLVRKYYGPGVISPGLIQSRFYVLHMTYTRCVKFWGSKTAMGQNLEMLEGQLERHCNSDQGDMPLPAHETREEHRGKPAKSFLAGRADKLTSCGLGAEQNNSRGMAYRYPLQVPTDKSTNTWMSHHENGERSGQAQYLPWSPRSTAASEVSGPKQSHADQGIHQKANADANGSLISQPLPPTKHIQTPIEVARGLNTSISTLELPPHSERNYMLAPESFAEPLLFAMDSPLFDPSNPPAMNMGGRYETDIGWRDIDLPIDIQDILSGMSTF